MKIRRMLLIAYPILAFASVLLSFSPLISGDSGGMLSCTYVVRAIQLMHYNAWGCVPLLIPLLASGFVYGRMKRAIQGIGLLILLCAGTVSYAHSFLAARAWIDLSCESLLTFHVSSMLYPLVLAGVCIVGFVLANIFCVRRIVE